MKNFKLEYRSQFTTKAIEDSEDIEIHGIANAVEKDRDGDIIIKEAWEKGALDNYVKNPIILAFHDHSRPIGKAVSHYVSDDGLHITAIISKAAGDIYHLIKQGILKTFSVGFRVKDADYDSVSDIFVIKDLELYEVSVVSVPANAGSTFSVRKALNAEDLEEFKKEFDKTPKVEELKKEENIEQEELLEEEKENMSTNETTVEKTNSELEAQVANLAAGLEVLLEAQAKAEAEKEEAKKALEAKIAQEEKAAKEKATEAKIESAVSGVDKLIADLKKEFEEKESEMGKVIASLKDDISAKAEELMQVQRSKMTFSDNSAPKRTIPQKEKDIAVLLSKTVGKPIHETKFGKDLIEKYGTPFTPTNTGEHLDSMNEDWETEFSTRIFDDIRMRLVVEPLFGTIQMNTSSMHLPVNPDAGIGEWIARSAFVNQAAREGATPGSTGTAITHEMTDITLVAHKLAAKEYLGYEEEEDTVLPLMSIIRDAVVRRMARSSDIAILRGDAGVSSGSGNWPFNGVGTLAVDASDTVTVGGATFAAREPLTVANLGSARQLLGNWGLNPADVVYLVSPDSYYELLQDADFRTMDMVGEKATILTGQIGMVNGSPVIVSGEFAAPAIDGIAAVALNTSNFYVGNLRGLLVERDRDVIAQSNVLVATRRFDFAQIIAGEGTAAVVYQAS